MCGIAGIWSNHRHGNIDEDLKKMTSAIIHRGPDGSGHWISKDGNVALGHRRLAVIDLSNAGAQPMHFMDRYIITFNGEIYNYLELKLKLSHKGHVFKSDSDTEVILAAYSEFGVACLSEFDGMFAFAIYDKVKHELFCARDRFGEKPFYYTFFEGNFIFASEMKALWNIGVSKDMNDTMIYQFLANDLVENPNNQTETFYKNIFKLKNSSYIIYSGDKLEQINYWQINIEQKYDYNFESASTKFYELFTKSVERRLRSDVQVGTSLSGGLDSSSVVGVVSNLHTSNHTFSARFENFVRDEGKYIQLVSDHFQTNHQDVFVDQNQLSKELDKLVFHQEEPFISGSIFAQYKVYEAARKSNVVVMLDGQGADEYLCGYAKDFSLITLGFWSNLAKTKSFKSNIAKNHDYKLNIPKRNLLIKHAPCLYNRAQSLKQLRDYVPIGIHHDFHEAYKPQQSPFHLFGSLKETLKHEMTNQGLEKLLRFADRNSMAHSVEVRLPFLSHELVEFVFGLPEEYLMFEGWSKALLRKAMAPYLPEEISYRKDKIGFEAPTKIWERDKLLIDLVSEAKSTLLKKGIITGNYDNGWKVLMLSRYFEK